ncbi:MAG TPA: GNAT family N-acetyltransferase [Petrotogaceae bacterium]|nr:GNAT family N-acetyltransferase [Petrotogaceae bacterium]HQO12488.1 GNAT family N-acetyltransferase [Petrotogaceae bacterium]HQP58433.1 GNAT family N-acetyltransferase [Petrotogaceae bacterium]
MNFKELKKKAADHIYSSLSYVSAEDMGDVIQNFFVVCDKGVFIISEEKKQYHVLWACDDFSFVVDNIRKFIDEYNDFREEKRIFIEFVQPKDVVGLAKIGFKIVSEWLDYWVEDINKIDIQRERFSQVFTISEDEYYAASGITLRCAGQSREYEGEDYTFVREWARSRNSKVLVYKQDENVCGVCFISIYRSASAKANVLWVRELAVDPLYQGKGVATVLLNKALEYGKNWGAYKSFLAVDRENFRAVRIYEKIGFHPKAGHGQINMAYNVLNRVLEKTDA